MNSTPVAADSQEPAPGSWLPRDPNLERGGRSSCRRLLCTGRASVPEAKGWNQPHRSDSKPKATWAEGEDRRADQAESRRCPYPPTADRRLKPQGVDAPPAWPISRAGL